MTGGGPERRERDASAIAPAARSYVCWGLRGGGVADRARRRGRRWSARDAEQVTKFGGAVLACVVQRDEVRFLARV